MGPNKFGHLSYLLALVAISGPFMALGLNSIVTREIVARPSEANKIVGSGLVLRFTAGLITAILGISLASFFLDEGSLKLLMILIISSTFNASLVVDFWLQAKMANRQGAKVRLVILVLFSLAKLTAIKLNADLSIFIYIASAEFIVSASLYAACYHFLSSGLKSLRITIQEIKQLLLSGRWLLFSGIAAVIYLKVDQIMLGVMLDDAAVGVYSVAARVSEVWYFVPAAIVTSVFPQLILKRSINPLSYAVDLQKLNDLLFLIALAVVCVIIMSGEWLILLLFGQEYREAGPVLLVHIWAGIFVFMRCLLSKWLIAENLLKLSLLSQLLGATVNVGLNIKFIPLYGPIGAAYATLLSCAVAGYGVLFFHRDLRPMMLVVTKSIMLPYRLIKKGSHIYRI